MADAINDMQTLNKVAAETMLDVGINACTDITGFGLLGHAQELAEASQVGLEIEATSLHIYPQVMEFAQIGLIPVGSYRNREHYLPKVTNRDQLEPEVVDILADPQTSGGLLISVSEEKVAELCDRLETSGGHAFKIGRVAGEHPGELTIT
jgi:selenide,water dikinase